MRKLCVMLLFVSCLLPELNAQTRRARPARRGSATTNAAPTRTVVTPFISVDTTISSAYDYVLPDIDTVRKDTSTVGLLAQEVRDSLKAQVKAPIVQLPVRLKTLIIPGAFFAYGAITLNSGSLRGINQEVREWLWDGNLHGSPYMEDYMLLVPAAAVYALNIVGVKGQNNLVDRSIIYGMSNLISNGIIFGVKKVGIETRPDGSDKHSFPSGHTAQAFVSAEFFHQEYKGRIHWTATAAGYAFGIATGYLRMAHNKHWLGDVVAGAGVGIASTRFAYYLYPILKNIVFGSKKVRESAMIMPTYNGGMPGLALMYRF